MMTTDLYGLVNPDVVSLPQLEPNTGNPIFLIQEMAEEGEMHLAVEVMGQCLQIHFNNNKNFALLRNRKCADGIIWEDLGNGSFRLHLFEMKKTIDVSKWNIAKQQYYGTFLKCRMIAGLVGVDIDSCIHLYTVFCEDGLSSGNQNNTDPAMERTFTDAPPEEKEWSDNYWDYYLTPLNHGRSPHWGTLDFQHHKIHLVNVDADGIPEGRYDLEKKCPIP